MPQKPDPVLIVGAGPTGLMLAIELARRDVPVHIIDQRPAPLPWDRAAVVKSRSLEIFAALGLADEFVRRGKKIRGADFYERTARRASFRLADLDTPFPFTLGLSESETEKILTAELERLGVTIDRGVTFIGMEAGETGARVSLRDAKGERSIKADWVVGTDGLHSKVRDAVGIAFEGHDYPLHWGVVDAHFDGWPHPDDVIAVQFNPPLVSIPIGGGKWRVYFRGKRGETDLLPRIAEWLRNYAPDASLVDPDEPQLFHTHCRIAANYRSGPVLLAGDAAHACSPMEGHGMNTGIQDAFNLGWKLALVVKEEAPESLLDSYDIERRAMAAIVGDSGDNVEATSALPGNQGIEAIAAALAVAEEQHKAAIAETELGLNYEESPILGPRDEAGAERQVGHWVGETGPHNLIDYDRHTVLLLLGEADEHAAGQSLDTAKQIAARHAARLRFHAVAKNGAAPRHTGIEMVDDKTGAIHRRLGAGKGPCLCIVRPDGHLALRCSPPSAQAVDAYFARIFG
jgi:2-polyprenyl-6-methoxyphenol hydroxylase-like FAD-dependent oxidoreductase